MQPEHHAGMSIHRSLLHTLNRLPRLSTTRVTSIATPLLFLIGGCTEPKPADTVASPVPLAAAQPDSSSGYAPVNGLRMYHEIHGSGTPLVLIHGGGSTIHTTWGRVLHQFAKEHQVIAVEMQAHGRTADIDRPLSFAQDADDISELLKYLKIPKADIMGFSNGGTTALQFAIRHPEMARKVIVASAIAKRSGAQPWLWPMMDKAQFKDMPQAFNTAFLAVNPDSAALHRMFDRDNARMRSLTDIPDEQLRAIILPTLIISGEQDVATPEHTVEMHRLIPGSRLMILPGGHGDYIGEITTPQDSTYIAGTVHLVENFLEAPMP